MNPNLTPAQAEADIDHRLGNITYLDERTPVTTPAEDYTLRVGLVVAFEHHTVKVLSFGATLVNIKARREGFKTQRLSVPRSEFEEMLAKRQAEATT